MEYLQKNKNIVITLLVILVIALVGFVVTRDGGNETEDTTDTDSVLPNVEVLPTVDPSVEVDLIVDSLGQEATLIIENYPDGTDMIEYELSYDALVDGDPVPKGVIGTIDIDDSGTASKDITLGTCSSGVCKYDKGVELIKVTLKFEGDYGAQLYEGEFEL